MPRLINDLFTLSSTPSGSTINKFNAMPVTQVKLQFQFGGVFAFVVRVRTLYCFTTTLNKVLQLVFVNIQVNMCLLLLRVILVTHMF
jgi:hypothetical protein